MRYLSSVRTRTFSRRGSSRRTFIVNSGQVLLIGAGLVAGLGRARMVGAASQVTIGMASVPCQAPTYAALAQGYFEDEGLQPTAMVSAEVGDIDESQDRCRPVHGMGRSSAKTAGGQR